MKLRLLTLAAMFAALCTIGAFIKIPVGIGSAALDTVPALISASFLPPIYAGAASLIGHLSSSLYAGFPFGPLHIFIAIEMFVILFVYTKLHQAGHHIWKWIFFIFANSVLATLPFYWIISPAFFVSALPGITLATILNAAIAMIVSPAVERVFARVKTHA
ncbi:ECF transporter S component [Psychrobacillus sp. INOP01]|uniref:ECF transporter S component n=1 Tax=Psychrobacillus sp. INOP01 TaxID=2829187 RepID=UPI001BAAB7A4|nr:ECF transporter S component [Psychrobacillus sp. INOP01]QUG40467.1 ECF transporter S component [Psychrobacillus sp. INOP01]